MWLFRVISSLFLFGRLTVYPKYRETTRTVFTCFSPRSSPRRHSHSRATSTCHRARADRGDREDSPALRTVGRERCSWSAGGGSLGPRLKLKVREGPGGEGSRPALRRRGPLNGSVRPRRPKLPLCRAGSNLPEPWKSQPAAEGGRSREKPFLSGDSARFHLELPFPVGQASGTSEKQTPIG